MADDARRYFAAAETFLRTLEPRLIAVGGLSGSGKTTLAAAVAPHLGPPPGAVHLRSDIERKALAGVSEMERLPQSTYTQHASDAVYSSLRRKAKLALGAGYSVIVDAVHSRPIERDDIAALAKESGIPFVGLWLDAPAAVLEERVRKRVGDASDATEEVVRRQAKYDLGPMRWHRLDSEGELAEGVAEAIRIVQDDAMRGE
jgi:predicted kinase